jgi:anaerobic selenocysteine-containing dehydrogenase
LQIEEQSLTREHRPSFCRVCINYCPIVVTVEGGRAVRVEGDRVNPVWKGHTCVKGRAQHERLYSEHRLLHSQRRTPNGTYEDVSTDAAMDEIADRLEGILERNGPDAIAFYAGTSGIQHATTDPFSYAFFSTLGVRRVFTPSTIDKPGKGIAKAMHGGWQAPGQGYDDPEAVLLVGANPLVSYEGAPIGHPGWLNNRAAAGMALIVIDPRRTETAKLATLHLRPRPGHDSAILAALLRVIIDENLIDRAFVEEDVTGVDRLRTAIDLFTPEAVARTAGLDAADIQEAARVYATARRGYTFAGTGPSMSDPGPLTEYLVLCLESLCGRWLRAGERVHAVPALFRTPEYKAQAAPARPVRNPARPFRVRGLVETVAGPPTAAIADEILLGGDGAIRALISCGGNPVASWPDHDKVVSALRSLELLVQIDPVMSATAQLADFVIAPKMPLETPDISQWHDFLAMHSVGFGNATAHGHYTPAIVEPPAGSDVIGEWEFFYGLAQRMGLALEVTSSCFGYPGIEPFSVDMKVPPDEEALLAQLARGSRIPLDEVKRYPHGQPFPEPAVFVKPKDRGWPHRLECGNAEMMEALTELATRELDRTDTGDGREFRLICRRTRAMVNTWLNDGATSRGRTYNPAYLHPDDLRRLDLQPGDTVEIESAHGAVLAIVESDDTLLPGLLSISHGYGAVDTSGTPIDDPRVAGTSIERLLSDSARFDPYSGMPLMSDVPVDIRIRRRRMKMV